MKYQQKSLDKYMEDGSVSGYTTDTRDVLLENYLEGQGHAKYVETIRKAYRKIAILTNLYVEEENRGNGIGTEFVGTFLEDAAESGCEAVVLVADTLDSNAFDLVKWYEGWGFRVLSDEREDCPLMVLTFDQ